MSDVDIPPRAFPVPQVLIRAQLPADYGGAAREPQRFFGAHPLLTQPQDFPHTCTRASVRSVLMASCSLA